LTGSASVLYQSAYFSILLDDEGIKLYHGNNTYVIPAYQSALKYQDKELMKKEVIEYINREQRQYEAEKPQHRKR